MFDLGTSHIENIKTYIRRIKQKKYLFYYVLRRKYIISKVSSPKILHLIEYIDEIKFILIKLIKLLICRAMVFRKSREYASSANSDDPALRNPQYAGLENYEGSRNTETIHR